MQVILYNSLFFHQKYGGVSRYSSCLLDVFLREGIDVNLIAPIYKSRYLNNIKNSKIHGIYIPRYPNLNLLQKLNNKIVNYYKKKNSADIVHDFYYSETNQELNKKRIITIHDTIHEKFKDYYKINYLEQRKKIVDQTDIFICVSQNTKNDFMQYYKISEDRIVVIGHGFEHLKNLKEQNFPLNKNLNKPFILYVGGRYKYKNFKILIEAFSKIPQIKDNFNIVCYGGENISKSEFSYFKNLGIEKKIIKLNGDDILLKNLYKNCKLLVSTSEYEGFGLTALEAVYLNCPVLANDIKVLREIYKDSINYYEFNSLDHLIFNLKEILINNNIKTNFTNKKEILKNNSWEVSTKKTLEIYKSISD